MLAHLLILGLLLQTESSLTSAKVAAEAKPKVASAETDSNALRKVTRIYVESFEDDIISKELQSMLVTALVSTKRFKVTENREKADAVLKGVALEKTSQELHAYGEATSVGGASGGGHSDASGSSGGFIARRMGIDDSSVHTETVNEARVAVRLVNPDGDVIWTTTQESKGAKYKGSSADVADRCVKQLLRDLEKIENAKTPPPSSTSATAQDQTK